ncbi:hypothetical protein KAE78_06970 [Microbacterium sp. NIBRBAC000506063]|nr:hypothetical protein KAE78_06970 [Microbacterium sp. NIBRBAC000506063]
MTLEATAVSATAATSTASAAGAPEETPEDTTEENGKTGVDKKVAAQRGFADSVAGDNGVAGSGSAEAPSAETSDGPVSVAAAVGIVVSTVLARTIITSDADEITAGTTVRLAAAGNADAASAADGSATGGSAAIGAGVAVTLSRLATEATVPAHLTVEAHDVEIAAVVAADGDDDTSTISARSASGAAADVGIAGSVAIAIVDHDTTAALHGTVRLTGGDLTLTAASAVKTTVTALPAGDGVTGDSVGIGVSFALAILDDATTALIADGAQVLGARDITLDASAVTEVTTEARMGAASGADGVAVTPAVAITLSNAVTTAEIGIATDVLTLSGSLRLNSTQRSLAASTAGATAVAGSAAVGFGLALTIAPHGAKSTLARNVNAGQNISIRATSVSSASASGSASAAGAPAADDDEEGDPEPDVDEKAAAQRSHADKVAGDNGVNGTGDVPAPSAETSDGTVSVAAAIAIVISTVEVEAGVTTDVTQLTAGGEIILASAANADAASTADGSATDGETAAIGAAVALTLATVTNRAVIPDWLTVNAHALTLSATVAEGPGGDTTATISAEAAAGAAGGVGVAGAVAIAIIDQETIAAVLGTVVLSGGALTLTAASDLESTVKALPVGDGAAGDSVGVGVSFALTLLTDDVFAYIDDGVSLTGAGDVSLAASAKTVATTEARMGSAGDVAVTPAIAITLSNVTTRAWIGAGSPLEASGSLSIVATQDASATSIAGAEAVTTGSAAIGFGLGLTIANHGALTVLARDVEAGGDVTLRATSRSVAKATGSASASGAPEETEEDAEADDQGRTGVDKLVGAQRDYADQKSLANGGTGAGDAEAPKSETSDGSVTVAAAIGIAISSVTAESRITEDVTSIIAGGTVTLATSANTDAMSAADGSATDGGTAAIGAGVALSVSNVRNIAIVPDWVVIQAHGLTVSATVTVVGDDATSTVSAEAAAGAAGGVSVAGSLAIAVVNQYTIAEVKGTVILTGGDVLIEAASALSSIVKALPVGAGSTSTGSVGVGIAFALNLILDETFAALRGSAQITGANNLTMTANARVDAETEARMGASSTGTAAVAPAIAVTSSDVDTAVLIEALGDPESANLIEIDGDLSAVAQQRTSTITRAGAEASGATTASVGVALALTLANHAVLARTDRSITAGGGIEFGALGSSHNEAHGQASASGAPDEDANAGDTSSTSGGSVDEKLSAQRLFANEKSQENGGKGVRNDSDNPSAESSDGTVSVAAAIALTIADVSAIAMLPDGLTLVAGGPVVLRASQNVDGITSADGTATDAETAGIGAAVALTLVTLVNRAGLGANTTVTANGFSATATMTDVDGDTTHTFSAEASSGAGSGNVGVAGSFALNVTDTITEAFIPSSAVVSAGTGDVTLRAENHRVDTVRAKADARATASVSAPPSPSTPCSTTSPVPRSRTAPASPAATTSSWRRSAPTSSRPRSPPAPRAASP